MSVAMQTTDTVKDETSGLECQIKTIRPYRVYDELLGIEQMSRREMQTGSISKRDAWLCSLNAAGDVLLNREPSQGMEAYRTMEKYL